MAVLIGLHHPDRRLPKISEDDQRIPAPNRLSGEALLKDFAQAEVKSPTGKAPRKTFDMTSIAAGSTAERIKHSVTKNVA